MVRTQIQLTEDQAERLKAEALRQGISMAELIRRSVDGVLASRGPVQQDNAWERAARASGRFRSGTRGTSAGHDGALAEAYAK